MEALLTATLQRHAQELAGLEGHRGQLRRFEEEWQGRLAAFHARCEGVEAQLAEDHKREAAALEAQLAQRLKRVPER